MLYKLMDALLFGWFLTSVSITLIFVHWVWDNRDKFDKPVSWLGLGILLTWLSDAINRGYWLYHRIIRNYFGGAPIGAQSKIEYSPTILFVSVLVFIAGGIHLWVATHTRHGHKMLAYWGLGLFSCIAGFYWWL